MLRGVESDLNFEAGDAKLIPDRLGLAFSGGGIRSACVALGVLQSLARARILRQVHYISGISGGGYTLAWITAWIHRANATEVEEQLADNSDSGTPEPVATPPAYRRHIEPFPIHYLRRYSSYLNPRAGLLSGDTLAMISIYLRNVLLNQVMLGCAALAILLLLQFPAFMERKARPIPFWPSPTYTHWYGALLPSAWLPPAHTTYHSTDWYGVLLRPVAFAPFAILLLLSFIAGLIFTWNSVCDLERRADAGSQTPNTNSKHRNNAFWALFCGVIACTSVWLLTPLLYAKFPDREIYALFGLFLLAVVGFAITSVHNWNDESSVQRDRHRRIIQSVLAWAAVLIAAIGYQSAFHRWVLAVSSAPQRGSFLVFGLPAILVVLSLQTYLWVGIMGKAFPDSRREWLARAAGYFLAYAAIIALLFSIAYFGPLCMHLFFTGFRGGGWKKVCASFGITGGWLATVLTGILGGRSAQTHSRTPSSDTSPKALNAVVLLAPPVFIVGVLLCASFASHSLVRHIVWKNPPATYCDKDYLPCADWRAVPSASHRLVWGTAESNPVIQPLEQRNAILDFLHNHFSANSRYFILVALFLFVAVILAICLDVNEFSLHLFYRNRLVRAFLGASRPEMYRPDGQDPRRPNPFTGFAPDDDIELKELTAAKGFQGPYPIWGTCLNLTTGEDLAWQQRKGASFIYSPLYSGWDYVNRFGPPTEPEEPAADPDKGREQRHKDKLSNFGFRSNLPLSDDIPGYGGTGGAPWIGTAMAASGAAVSPNSGYHTSPGVAALLTLFNVRLGWWTGNPRHPRCWKQYAPGIWYLLSELLGEATDRAGYVYLSDGGHFENLGIYELVRRRVRFIICSDADADPNFGFGDLGNAIDHCRRDFGVEINVKAQTRIAAGGLGGFREAHYAVGEICYPGQTQPGILLYIKSSLTSDEPGDVLGMKATDNAFPHDTTLNQFFDEKKFEAYRALGEHMMEFILQSGGADGAIPMTPLDSKKEETAACRVRKLFERLCSQI